jgi:CubicO group peptidase (beta-lactamase class C family)
MLIAAAALLALACLGCAPGQPGVPEPDYWPTSDWQTASPESQAMDAGRLANLVVEAAKPEYAVHGILVVRNGYVVLEHYAPPYTRYDRHTVESNTKSVIGALIGIAIDRKQIGSENARLADFFPGAAIANLDGRKKRITLSHLLAMTAGLDCADGTQAAADMYAAQDWTGYLLDRPVITQPGKKWAYASGDAHLLSAVISAATGMDARTYANRVLFGPLSIREPRPEDWTADPRGVTNGIAGLYITPRELAKLGFLYLHKGTWDGTRVVPESWVDASTRQHAFIGKDPYAGGLDRRWGYLFSLFPEQGFYGYLGMCGQILLVMPRLNLVVVITAAVKPGTEGGLLRLATDFITPAAMGGGARPEPAGQRRLDSALAAAAGAPALPPSPPAMAARVSGVTWTFGGNPLGWTSLLLRFTPGARAATVEMPNIPPLAVGLDGDYRRTQLPGQRPVALRGSWKDARTFAIDYVTIGETTSFHVELAFDGGRMEASVATLPFGGDPLVLRAVPSRR